MSAAAILCNKSRCQRRLARKTQSPQECCGTTLIRNVYWSETTSATSTCLTSEACAKVFSRVAVMRMVSGTVTGRRLLISCLDYSEHVRQLYAVDERQNEFDSRPRHRLYAQFMAISRQEVDERERRLRQFLPEIAKAQELFETRANVHQIPR